MKVTIACLAGIRDLTVRNWNIAWLRQGQFYDNPVKVPPALMRKGVDIVDMKEYMNPKHVKWTPPVTDDPRWVAAIPPEERPDWKAEAAFSLDQNVQIYEGVKQACLIAKAQHFEGIPETVDRLVGAVETPDRDLLLQRYVMLSQKWNTDDNKLPKRKSKEKSWWDFQRYYGIESRKASQILMRNLLRLCQSHRAEFPSLAKRKRITDPLLESYVMYRDKPIVLRDNLDVLVTSDTWLPPFADEDLIDASVAHKIPDMWPVFPTVDFSKTNNYELCSHPGFHKDNQYSCPHTIVQFPRKLNWSDSQYQASQVMTCLLLTAAAARRRFGEVRHLPEPICVQHAILNESQLLLTYFQLNTLDLDNHSGVKNMVWTTKPSEFFTKLTDIPIVSELEYMKIENFDGSGFEPFMASYLNGVPELA